MALIKTKNIEHIIEPIKVIDIARVERSTALADGIFLPKVLPAVKRTSFLIKVPFKMKESQFISEWMGIQLDAFDLSLFLALSKLVSVDSKRNVVTIDNCNPKFDSVMNFNGKKVGKEKVPFCYIKTSYNEILNEAGYSNSGLYYKKAYQSIMRMAGVRVNVYSKEQESKPAPDVLIGSSLLGNFVSKSGDLVIAYNPMIMAMLNGFFDSCLVDMKCMKNLSTDVSKKLLFWLSAWASHDRFQRISIDKLHEHVWSEVPKTDELKRKRRFQIRKSLLELSKFGWLVSNIDDIYTIKRPKY